MYIHINFVSQVAFIADCHANNRQKIIIILRVKLSTNFRFHSNYQQQLGFVDVDDDHDDDINQCSKLPSVLRISYKIAKKPGKLVIDNNVNTKEQLMDC